MIHCALEEKNDSLIIIRVSGEMRIDVIPRIESIWNGALSKKPKVIAFDCTKMEYIDSSSIGTLVKFMNSAMNKNVEFVIYGLNREVSKIFETARLMKFFNIVSPEAFESRYVKKQ
ncbi:MAG: STAS domain-containing protein [Spirochaetes bacterium]|nr:STAS domain-containing protein [Spirochaetota bacterium]